LFVHHTVLLVETVALLQPAKGKLIIDATLGAGGHSEKLLEAGARVVGIDKDPRALAAARERLSRFGDQFRAVQGDGADARALVGEPAHGFLMDLGVSSPQLDTAERGFSFQSDGPLDMRMGDSGETAAELIARLDDGALADVIYEFGEEHSSRSIARALKAAQPRTTFEAVAAIKRGLGGKAKAGKVHPATKTFQALRIAVNDELGSLDRALAALPEVLEPQGRAAFITFHSLEDRRVKNAFKRLCGEVDEAPRGMPVAQMTPALFKSLTKKAVTAGEDEVAQNPRARSAKLRGVEKL
jgi:16S rRNA (cytosine1402-N4)-methyltransferase